MATPQSSSSPKDADLEDKEMDNKEGFLTGQTVFVGRSEQQFQSSSLTKWWNSVPVSIKVRLVVQPSR